MSQRIEKGKITHGLHPTSEDPKIYSDIRICKLTMSVMDTHTSNV
jgi:hypothetical protein